MCVVTAKKLVASCTEYGTEKILSAQHTLLAALLLVVVLGDGAEDLEPTTVRAAPGAGLGVGLGVGLEPEPEPEP